MDPTSWISAAAGFGGFLIAFGGLVWGAWRSRSRANKERERAVIEALNRQTDTVAKLVDTLPVIVDTIRGAVVQELQKWRTDALLAEIDELRRDKAP